MLVWGQTAIISLNSTDWLVCITVHYELNVVIQLTLTWSQPFKHLPLHMWMHNLYLFTYCSCLFINHVLKFEYPPWWGNGLVWVTAHSVTWHLQQHCCEKLKSCICFMFRTFYCHFSDSIHCGSLASITFCLFGDLCLPRQLVLSTDVAVISLIWCRL